MVNQILARNFHSTDVDILNYTTNLMDKLEQVRIKQQNQQCEQMPC